MKVKYLHTNARPSEQPEGSYAFAKNGIIDYLTDAIRNEPGMLQLLSVVTPYKLNGIIETDTFPILFSTDNTNSAIGFFNTTTNAYQGIVNDKVGNLLNWPANGDLLGFKNANYITGEAQRNFKGELITAFTDKVTFAKYLNCDNPAIKGLTDLRLSPYFSSPNIALTQGTGGNLLSGTYYVAVSYEKNDGTVTNKSDVSDSISLGSGTFSTISDKSVDIKITAADLNYDFIRVYVIAVVDGKTSTKELSDLYPVSAGTIEILYTGNNLSQEITLAEVLTPGAIYSTIGTLGQLNDSLYAADLVAEKEIDDMQGYASQAVVKFKSELLSTLNPPPEHISGKKKGFMHEEVYAIYIRYKLVTGGFTKAFLTIGQASVAGDIVQSTDATTAGYGAVLKYKVEDTIRTFDVPTLTGSPGTWLNSVERYPLDVTNKYGYSNGIEDLRGQPVRHHKMPSIRWCKQNLYSAVADYGRGSLDLLGIYVDNVIIPAKYTGRIVGYQLLYAKRSPATTIIQAQGGLLHPVTVPGDIAVPNGTAPLYSSGGNVVSTVGKLSGSTYTQTFGLQALTKLRTTAMRFHGFDLLFNKPAITPTFISRQYKMRTTSVQYIEDDNMGVGGLNDGPIILLADYSLPTADAVTASPSANLRTVTQSFYLDIGINISGFVNQSHETCFAGFLGTNDWALTEPTCGYVTNKGFTPSSIGLPAVEEMYLINLLTVKEDVYASFQNQTLISAGQSKAITDTGILNTFFTGDTFACSYVYHTYGRYNSDDIDGDGIRGRRIVRRIACESVSNQYLRYEIPGDVYSRFYGPSPLTFNGGKGNYIALMDRKVDPNHFGYSKSLNALNEFVSTTAFNPFIENNSSFPFRIHRFGKVSRQSKFRNWRTALPLDYYECQKNMGRIINLDSMNDRLLIHHESALFITQDKAKLQGGGAIAVTVGSGDIFQFEPQMVVDTKLGYGGTQHELSCTKIPPGYVFADVKINTFFLYSGGKLKDLGNEDMSVFLQKYLSFIPTNNYTGGGITIGWDPDFNRILFTVTLTGGVPGFTLSYSLESAKWAFFHDYFPMMYINTRRKLYSTEYQAGQTSSVWKLNAAPMGSYPLGMKSFFIDVIFRADQDLIAECVKWRTDFLTNNDLDINTLGKTITHISMWNSHQHSGRIALKDYNTLDIQDMRRTKGMWSFNSLRNKLDTKGQQFLDSYIRDYNLVASTGTKAWYDKELLSDTWFCVRFEYDNSIDAKVVVHDTALQAIKAPR